MNGRSHKISTKYILFTLLAVILSWELHEIAHWTIGELLGYDMTMSLNKTFFSITSKGQSVTVKDNQLVSAAGPIFTLLEAFLCYLILRQFKYFFFFLYPIIFTCFYMRLLAATMSIINPNDEARISQWLGWGTYTLPSIIVCILFYLLYSISRFYKVTSKFNLISLLLIISFSSLIILADQYFSITILR